MGPLEQEIAELLERPVDVPDQGWVRADGHPPDAEERVRLASLGEERLTEYLFLRVEALGDALRRIARAIDQLQAAAGNSD